MGDFPLRLQRARECAVNSNGGVSGFANDGRSRGGSRTLEKTKSPSTRAISYRPNFKSELPAKNKLVQFFALHLGNHSQKNIRQHSLVGFIRSKCGVKFIIGYDLHIAKLQSAFVPSRQQPVRTVAGEKSVLKADRPQEVQIISLTLGHARLKQLRDLDGPTIDHSQSILPQRGGFEGTEVRWRYSWFQQIPISRFSLQRLNQHRVIVSGG